MRWSVLALLLLSGCFNPHYGNPSFFCHPEDNPACPDGQQCVGGRCVAEGAKPIDLGSGGGGDGAMSLPDLSTPSGPVDMKQPKDLSSSACVATGGDCTYHNNAVCCSNYCVYASNTCK